MQLTATQTMETQINLDFPGMVKAYAHPSKMLQIVSIQQVGL